MISNSVKVLRYDRFTRILHWVVAVIIIYAICVRYILHALEGTRWFNFFSELNMSLATIATTVMLMCLPGVFSVRRSTGLQVYLCVKTEDGFCARGVLSDHSCRAGERGPDAAKGLLPVWSATYHASCRRSGHQPVLFSRFIAIAALC